MKIRDYKEEDYEAVKQLAEEHKLNLSIDGKIIVAETNSGKVVGFANIRPVFMIEPFVCKNPLVADKLWKYVSEKSRKGNIKILRCFANEKNVKLYMKLGFYKVFKKMIPMEINFFKPKG